MQTSTIVVLACLLAVVVAKSIQEPQAEVTDLLGSMFETPKHDSSPRSKRGLLLLKKKFILGALGLKAAKVGAVAAAGALALKSKSKSAQHAPAPSHTYYHHGTHPHVAVEVHRW